MNAIEIRQDLREYILSDVNLTLSRLGISEKVAVVEDKPNKYGNYILLSPAIRQMPVMFRELVVDGYMTANEPNEGDRFYSKDRFIIVVKLEYSYKHFDGGSNGCDIGRVIYLVDKDLPKKFTLLDTPDYYVRKVESLAI